MRFRRLFLALVGAALLAVVPMATQALASTSILFSTSADRSAPVSLDGAEVQGSIYVFAPDNSVKQVSFFIDDPAMAGAPVIIEGLAPFDLAGTAANGDANPFDTGTLSGGAHTVTAQVVYDDNSEETLHADFTVIPGVLFARDDLYIPVGPARAVRERGSRVNATDGSEVAYTVESDVPWITVQTGDGVTPDRMLMTIDPSALDEGRHFANITALVNGEVSDVLPIILDVFGLMLSDSPDRSNPVPLRGETVVGDMFVFLPPDIETGTVEFYLDDRRREGDPIQIETLKPIDFAGTAPDGTANPFDTTTLEDGWHNIVAGIELQNGRTRYLGARFLVDNLPPALKFGRDLKKFSVDVDGTQTKTVRLRNDDRTAVPYEITDDAAWLTTINPVGTTPETIELMVDATGLAPGLYNATVTATAPGHEPATLTVSLHVGFDVQLSLSPDRSDPADLHRQTVAGNIYVFVQDPSIVSVSFLLDAESRDDEPFQVEALAPFDFAGTASDGSANAFDTTTLENGRHVIHAIMTLSDGTTEVARAAFRVAN